jgi:hypothetical protein
MIRSDHTVMYIALAIAVVCAVVLLVGNSGALR